MEESIELSNPTPEEVVALRSDLEAGNEREESIRTLLAWFGFQRRGVWVSSHVRKVLNDNGITVTPDLDLGWIDSRVVFQLASAEGEVPEETAADDPICETERSAFVPEIGMLEKANTVPASVCRDDKVEKAVSVMLMNNYSQLPVIQGGRNVAGMISWESIGSYYSRHAQQAVYVRDCIQPFVEIVDYNLPLFEVTKKVIASEYVLVRGKDQAINGIITTSDISGQFRELSESFLLVGEIENAVRIILSGVFKRSELQSVLDSSDTERVVSGLIDLTFGEYLRIFQNPSSWEKLNLSLDRQTFCERLDTVRMIRNEIMHFHPDGISPEDVDTLVNTSRFLRELAR